MRERPWLVAEDIVKGLTASIEVIGGGVGLDEEEAGLDLMMTSSSCPSFKR